MITPQQNSLRGDSEAGVLPIRPPRTLKSPPGTRGARCGGHGFGQGWNGIVTGRQALPAIIIFPNHSFHKAGYEA